MASILSDYGAENWVQQMLGVTSVPSGYYVALLCQEPGPGMDGTVLADFEPDTGCGYARQAISSGATAWVENGPYVTNINPITFGVTTTGYTVGGALVVFTHWALCTAATAGDYYAAGQLGNPQQFLAGADISLPAGILTVALKSPEQTVVF